MQSEPLTRSGRLGRLMRVPTFELSARWRWILFAAVLVACSIRYLAHAEVVLDDAFIYLDLARNWVAGHGPRFNPGDRHLPASSPAWIMLLAATQSVLPGVNWERISVGLTFACLVAACVPLHLLLAPRFPLAATMAPIAIFCASSVVSFCGYDTNFATASGLWLLQARRARWWRTLGPLAALFYLGRAEGAALGAAVLASAALARGWHARAVGQQLHAMAGSIVVGALLVALWHGYFYFEFGALLPSTLAARLAQGRSGWTTFAAALPGAVATSLGSPWLAAAGTLALVFSVPGLVAWTVFHCSLLSLSGIAQ
jgi:arabinofuranosyltransferase